MKSGLSEIDKLSGTLESNIPFLNKMGKLGKQKNSMYRYILALKVMCCDGTLIALTKSNVSEQRSLQPEHQDRILHR